MFMPLLMSNAAAPIDDVDSENYSDSSDEEGCAENSTTVGPDTEEPKALTHTQEKRSGHFKKLLKLVAEAKGAASKPVVYFVQKFFGGTKLIFVTGQTGTGKTTILSELTGLGLNIGWTMQSGTRNYEICPAVIDGEQYLFIDTGGFGAADMSDIENFKDILACLDALGPFVSVSGILAVISPPQARFRDDDIMMLRWLQCFGGPAFFRNITIITNKWDEFSPRAFEKSWRRFETELLRHEDLDRILNPPDRLHGGYVYHHGFPGGSGSSESYSLLWDFEAHAVERGNELRNMIRRRYGGPSNAHPAELQVIGEIRSGISPLDTQAGRVIRAKVVGSCICICEGRSVLQARQDQQLPLPLPSFAFDEQASQQTGQSILEKFWSWFDVAKQVAFFFREARKRSYESNNSGTRASPARIIWSLVKNWWQGPPPEPEAQSAEVPDPLGLERM